MRVSESVNNSTVLCVPESVNNQEISLYVFSIYYILCRVKLHLDHFLAFSFLTVAVDSCGSVVD